MKPLKTAIIGCGDFLRWNVDSIKNSNALDLVALFDTDTEKATQFGIELDAAVAEDAEALYADDNIDMLMLFVPPFLRKEMLLKAFAGGKHVITTKPLSPSVEECGDIIEAARKAKVRCGVMYGRTESSTIETLKGIFQDEKYGRLMLYKQDWLHHYPQWNNWALDPEKNGGPFMDAMIHNMNAATYLMGRSVERAVMYGEKLAHPDLNCNDTESMRLWFADGGTADLFITWAADLEVTSTKGNYREHIDQLFMVTEKGWHVTLANNEGREVIRLSRNGEVDMIEPKPIAGGTVFDRFVSSIEENAELPSDLISLADAAEDIRLIRES